LPIVEYPDEQECETIGDDLSKSMTILTGKEHIHHKTVEIFDEAVSYRIGNVKMPLKPRKEDY
jgi:hypothetical protein